jgi:hypothetical protein
MDREFILTEGFELQLKQFSNHKDLLIDIEQEILEDLQKATSQRDIISGAGGFTKVRVPFKGRKLGKSSSARIIYLDCPKTELVFLMMIYSKSNKSNISEAGKQVLKKMAQELKSWQPKKK